MLQCVLVASVFEVAVCHSCVDSCCVFGVVVALSCCCSMCCVAFIVLVCSLSQTAMLLGSLFYHGVSCGLNMFDGFDLADFEVVGLGGVHVLCCVCFLDMLALGFANVLVG